MRIDRRSVLLGGLGLAGGAAAQTPLPPAENARALVQPDPTEFIDLWPTGAPGAPSPLPVETHLFPDGGHGFSLRLARGLRSNTGPGCSSPGR